MQFIRAELVCVGCSKKCFHMASITHSAPSLFLYSYIFFSNIILNSIKIISYKWIKNEPGSGENEAAGLLEKN